MIDWVLVAQKAAEILGSKLVKAGAWRLEHQILGTPAERGMERVYTRALASLLIEIAEGAEDEPDPEVMKVAEHVLADLCSDDEAAELLLNIALRPSLLPVEELRERAAHLGYEPNTDDFPFVFDEAMQVLAGKVWEEFLAVASEPNSQIQGLVNAELLASVREHHRTLRKVNIARQRGMLPPRPNLVLGRAEELRRIARALGIPAREEAEEEREPSRSSRRVISLHGWPGVGKTTFISELCNNEDVLSHFSDGVFFLTIGRSPNTHRLAEHVCTILEVPKPPGATLDILKGHITNALSTRRVLLVFDDVWNEQDVSPMLLASRNSAMLIVTRRLDIAVRLATMPQATFKLELLSIDDSFDLLRNRAPDVVVKNTPACRKLAEALDGLPLGLRVAADMLQVDAESGFDVTDLISELVDAGRVLGEQLPPDVDLETESAEERRALATLRSLLQKSLERLDETFVQRFGRLGVLPPKPLSFDSWTAEDLWRNSAEDPDTESEEREQEQRQTREALRQLVRRGLVESAREGIHPIAVKLDFRSKKPERFWMHTLVSAFALDTLYRTEGESGVREAQQRRLEHYRRIVGAAAGALNQKGDAQYFSAYIMDLDLQNVRVAHEWARSRFPSDRRATEYLSTLLLQGSRAFADRLEAEEFLEWTRLAERAAREIVDPQALKEHRANLGAALLRAGRTEEALPYCEEALSEVRNNDDAHTETASLANLAEIYDERGEYDTALDYARRAEKAAIRADSPNVQAGAIGQQARFLAALGLLSEAEERFEAQRDFSWDKGELSRYAKALQELAKIRRDRPKDMDEAREMYEEAAQVFGDLREYSNYRAAVNGLGILETEAGCLDAGEEAFSRALKSAVEQIDKGDQARAKMHLGIVHRYRKTAQSFEAAEREFRGALPLASSSKEPDKLGDVFINLALLLYQDKNDILGAQEAAEQAIGAYAAVESEQENWARQLLGDLHGNH